MSPLMFLLFGAGALALTRKPGGGAKASRECPAGFTWQGDRCVPDYEVGPPQISLTGACEAWEMLPNKPDWFARYATPALAQIVTDWQAAPTGSADPFLAVPGDAPTAAQADEITYQLLFASPLAFATEEFPTVGAVCRLPTSDEPAETPAVQGLFDYVAAHVAATLEHYNLTGEILFTEQ